MKHLIPALLVCLSSVLVACGDQPVEVSGMPASGVEGISLQGFTPSNPNDVSNIVDAFNSVVENIYLNGNYQLPIGKVKIFQRVGILSNEECGFPHGKYKYGLGGCTFSKSDGTYLVLVGIRDSLCFPNNSLTHELIHVWLHEYTGNSDPEHTKQYWWGYDGLLPTINMEAGFVCPTNDPENARLLDFSPKK